MNQSDGSNTEFSALSGREAEIVLRDSREVGRSRQVSLKLDQFQPLALGSGSATTCRLCGEYNSTYYCPETARFGRGKWTGLITRCEKTRLHLG